MGRVYLPSQIVAPIPFECESIMVVVEGVSVEEARSILEGASYPLSGMRRPPGSSQESSA